MESIHTSFPLSELLDKASLDEIYEGDLDYMLCMFQAFVETVNPELFNLKQAFEEANIAEIRKVSHKIKPNFSMVGLPGHYELALSMEKRCDAEGISLDMIQDEFNHFYAEAQRAVEIIHLEAGKLEKHLENA